MDAAAGGSTALRLPVRGGAVRELRLPLPAPGQPPVGAGAPRMPLVEGGRPLKRWRYVAAFGPELMLCAGDARVGPLPQRWWAVVDCRGRIVERTSVRSAGVALAEGRLRIAAADVEVDVRLAESEGGRPVEVVSPSGRGGWIWTRKRVGVPVGGSIALRGARSEVQLEAIIDDSAGYHDRHTAWRWSAGVGRAESGERLGWNLVAGVHDSPTASERAVWVDGEPAELGPVRFADDLSGIDLPDAGRLDFTPWAAREHRTRLGPLRNDYRQPFGTFAGTLPGSLHLAEGYGVMEEHDAWW